MAVNLPVRRGGLPLVSLKSKGVREIPAKNKQSTNLGIGSPHFPNSGRGMHNGKAKHTIGIGRVVNLPVRGGMPLVSPKSKGVSW